MQDENFGPWTTAFTTGSRLELSAFWKRRMTRLVAIREGCPIVRRRHVRGLAALTLLVGLLPMLKAETEPIVVVEPPKEVPAEAPDPVAAAAAPDAAATTTNMIPADDRALAAASEARLTPQVRAIKRVNPAVVNIHTERKVNGMGTGIIIDERGYIVTCQIVVANTTSVRVKLHDGSFYTAQVISYDRKHDLAVIKIDAARPLPVAPMGTSSGVLLGESVFTIGNPYGYEQSISSGIITGMGRDVDVNEHQSYRSLLQTDAGITAGNSGGPLINLDGEVIGINVVIRAGAQRIGFALPIDDARKFIANLIDIRKLNETYHGLVVRDLKAPDQRQLVVDSVEANGPAAAAGFQPGDVVTQVAGYTVVDRVDLERMLLGRKAGDSVDVTVRRNADEVKLDLRLVSVSGRKALGADPGKVVPFAQDRFPSLVSTGESEDSTQAWTILGLRLEQADPSLLGRFRPRYNGGMKVIVVRPDGTAARHGITAGDILVGLGNWETTKREDVQYILNQRKFAAGEAPLKFFIVRGSEMLYGGMKLPTLPGT